MVLILDVTHYMFRTHDGKWVFSGKNTRFATALDQCLTCAPLNELSSNISTVIIGEMSAYMSSLL